jgi:hypothetical protein
MDRRLEALEGMRRLADRYVADEIGFSEFFPAVQALLGENFDPLDEAVEDLPGEAKAAVEFFFDWTGGEFGDSEGRVPKRSDWQYGVDTEIYSWVDQEQYRISFARAYERKQAKS